MLCAFCCFLGNPGPSPSVIPPSVTPPPPGPSPSVTPPPPGPPQTIQNDGKDR